MSESAPPPELYPAVSSVSIVTGWPSPRYTPLPAPPVNLNVAASVPGVPVTPTESLPPPPDSDTVPATPVPALRANVSLPSPPLNEVVPCSPAPWMVNVPGPTPSKMSVLRVAPVALTT